MKKYHIALTIFFIIVLTIAIATSVFLTQKDKTSESQAIVSGGAGKIVFTPETKTAYPGESFPMDIKVNTGGVAVSSLAVRISYPYTASTPELNVVDANGLASNTVYPDQTILATGDWSFPVKTVTRAGGKVTIDLAAINTSTSGFVSNSDTKIATVYFKANSAYSANPITVSVDTTQSRLMTKAEPTSDILAAPTNPQYTVKNDDTPPNAVSDLSITNQTSTSLTLSWTAPQDPGPLGRASSYDIRYSTSPITNANWGTATQATGEPTPATAGTTQTGTLQNLQAGSTYYFAMKSKDAAGNESSLSNVANGQTSASTLTFGVKLQSVSVASVTRDFTITLQNTSGAGGTYTKTFTSDASGIFRPTSAIPLTNLPGTGSYTVYAKESSHLRRKLGTIFISAGDNTTTAWNSLSLKFGDFDENNVLNIVDIGKILSVYTSLSVPVGQTNRVYDADANSVINIGDVAAVLANYNALVVNGD